jgi:hypothetical protein
VDPADPNAPGSQCGGQLLLLPTGDVLFTHGMGTPPDIYHPPGSPNPGWAPTISSYSVQLVRGTHNYSISGTQFNGLSQANEYGDDFQNATNYPLVHIVNNATGHVFYCRTHDHSTMGVATGTATVSTKFDVPSSAETGGSKLYVVANGIASNYVAVGVF